jgi:hypothetical protein
MSLKLDLSYKWMVSENRVLRRIFGPKREEVPGRWRKLQNLVPSSRMCGSIPLLPEYAFMV